MSIKEKLNKLSPRDYTEECLVYLVKYGVATEEEISLVTSVAGWTPEAMNGIIKYKTGLNNLSEVLDQKR